MYEQFYGLRERPFDLTPNPRYLVLTAAHREALSNLEYAVSSRKGVTLLLGEAGSGKTTIIRAAIGRQVERVHCVHINNPALTRNEFVEMLARRFDLSDAAQNSKTALLLELELLLQQRFDKGETTVLMIDEAQSLSMELLEEIRLLANIETNDQKLLSLVLAGQPELGALLDNPSLRQLKQRVALRCELRPLSMQEGLAYLAGRVRAAGGDPSRVFTREGAVLLHERAGGIPRTMNVIADNALITGFARGQAPVTRAIVTEVGDDFSIDMTAEPAAPAGEPTAVLDIARPGVPVAAAAEALPHQPVESADSRGARRTLFSSFTAKSRFLSRKGIA